jgi:hypothetical protein
MDRILLKKEDIESAQGPRVWDLGNRVLYDLCRTHPDHKSDDVIIAKVWLIGRSYAAQIERRKNAREIGDDFYEKKVACAIRNSSIDLWITSLKKADGPGSPKTIEVHKSLMELFRSIAGLGKRSLASKYLHFHRPDVFFIYDSRVRQSITKVFVPKLRRFPDIETGACDPEYKDFVQRCMRLRNHISTSFGLTLTPRELDNLLIKVGKEEKRARSKAS